MTDEPVKSIRLILIAGLCLVVSSCGSPKPNQAILGEWTAQEDASNVAIWTFSKDGTLEIKIGGAARPLLMHGKYHFTDDSTIVVERDPGDPAKNQTVQVSFETGQLVLTDENRKVMKFKRP